MTTIRIMPSLASNTETLHTGRTFSSAQYTRSQKWYKKRRFKS